jgi:hypothetical protein
MRDLSKKLTITIPTYSRWNQLNNVLACIQSDKNSNYSVVINDNNSDAFDETKLYKKYKEMNLKIYRNKKNLGVVRNAIKSIKRVNTQYMIIHSDDDPYSSELIANALLEFTKGEYIAVGAVSTEIDQNGERLASYPVRYPAWFYPLSKKNRVMRRIYYYLLPLSTGKVNFFYSIFDKTKFKSVDNLLNVFNKNPLLFFDEMLVFCALGDGPIMIQKGIKKELLQGNKKDYVGAGNGLISNFLEVINRVKLYYIMSDWREKFLIILLAPIKILIEILSKLHTNIYRNIVKSK